MPSIRNHMIEIPEGHPFPEEAGNVKCTYCKTKIPPRVCYFICDLTRKDYCQPCGCDLRYRRKKAEERNEDPPLTIEEAERRFEEAVRALGGDR